MAPTPQLPPPRPDQNYVSISALVGGYITLADHFFVYPSEPGASRTVPSLAFLLTHPNPPAGGVFGKSSKPYTLLFDLGLRKGLDRYKPVMQKHLDGRRPYTLGPGIKEQLEEKSLAPDAIDAVMLSHVGGTILFVSPYQTDDLRSTTTTTATQKTSRPRPS